MPKQILPPNHPDRPEWGIFADMTGQPRRYKEGMTEAEAVAVMKESLLGLWLSKPREVLRVGNRALMAARAKEYQKQPARFDEFIAFQQERMWVVTPDGKIPELVKDKSRGSYAYSLNYWQPSEGGMIPYLGARMRYIAYDFDKEQALKAKFISTQALENGGSDIAHTGEVVRRPRMSDTAMDDADPTERALEGVDLVAAREALIRAAGRDEDADPKQVRFSKGDAVRSGEEIDRVRAARIDRVRGLEKDAIEDFNESPNRGEYTLFTQILGRDEEPAPSPEDRALQLKVLARSAVETLRADLEEPDTIIADIEDWSPRKESFFHRYPDFIDSYCKKIATVEVNQDVAENREKDSALKLMGLDVTQGAKGAGSQFDAIDKAASALRASHMWNMKSDEDLLHSYERPDYHFLTAALNPKNPVPPELPPAEMFKAIKEMAKQWTYFTCRDASFAISLNKELERWDPGKDGMFNEVVQEQLTTYAIEKERAQQEIALRKSVAKSGPGKRVTDPELSPIEQRSSMLEAMEQNSAQLAAITEATSKHKDHQIGLDLNQPGNSGIE